MNPARIVAVASLMIEVVEDLADTEMDDLSAAECDLALMMVPHLADLRDILALARAEMGALAPRLLAQTIPAPG